MSACGKTESPFSAPFLLMLLLVVSSHIVSLAHSSAISEAQIQPSQNQAAQAAKIPNSSSDSNSKLQTQTPPPEDSIPRYEPTWESIDSRPLPAWYDEAKLGIFIHWGVFSVPSYSPGAWYMEEWFPYYWKYTQTPAFVDFMKKNYRPNFNYGDFASMFTAEFYNPYQWADIFQASGAKYIVFVSKHCEGFANWPSKYSFNWNSMDVGPNRDIVGELADAIKNHTSLKFGLYHCLYEWLHPLYLEDRANNFTTNNFARLKSVPELYEIVKRYEPELVWSDGDWEAPDTYWTSRDFIAWLYNDSPVRETVVTNDRYGKNITCHHGGYLTCMDRYNPGTKQERKFENAMSIDKHSWGFRRNANLSDYLSTQEILSTFIITVSCGGNMLMNVGPTKYGMIAPIFEERLRSVGDWLKVNGEAIYSSRPWTYQNDTINADVWYTSKNESGQRVVYALLLQWPESGALHLGAPSPSPSTTVTLLGYHGDSFEFQKTGEQGMEVVVPDISFSQMPCQWAWALRMTGITN